MTTSAAVPAKRTSVFEDIVDVFYAPGPVFERRRQAGFGIALLVYIVVNVALLFAARPVMQPMMDRQISAQIAKAQANPNLSAEQREGMERTMRRMADSPFAMLAPAIFLPVALFAVALLLWVAGKLFGSAATYSQAMMVTTFSAFPRVLLSAITTVYALVTGREVANQYALTLSPAAMLPDDASQTLSAALSRLDLGTLWQTALLGLGIAIVGRISRGKGYGAAAIVWLVAGVFVVVTALRQSMM